MTDIQAIIETEIAEIATIVAIQQERIMSDEDIQKLHDATFGLIGQGKPDNLILDLSAVSMLSSSALGFFINLRKHVQTNQGRLILCSMGGKVSNSDNDSYIYELFKIVKLDTVFDICKDRTEALAKLQ